MPGNLTNLKQGVVNDTSSIVVNLSPLHLAQLAENVFAKGPHGSEAAGNEFTDALSERKRPLL